MSITLSTANFPKVYYYGHKSRRNSSHNFVHQPHVAGRRTKFHTAQRPRPSQYKKLSPKCIQNNSSSRGSSGSSGSSRGHCCPPSIHKYKKDRRKQEVRRTLSHTMRYLELWRPQLATHYTQ